MISEAAFIGSVCFSFVGGSVFAMLAFRTDLRIEAYWRDWERRRADAAEKACERLAKELKQK